jgi:hypothetical protein
MAAALFALLWSSPAAALDLFAQHEVTVQFATPAGKPMADAEVRVFAPGRANQPALTGRTDSAGKFEFSADSDGMWSAEARSQSEIARVMVRVGGVGVAGGETKPLSLWWLVGGLPLLLALAVGVRVLRARNRRRPPNRSGSPPPSPADR